MNIKRMKYYRDTSDFLDKPISATLYSELEDRLISQFDKSQNRTNKIYRIITISLKHHLKMEFFLCSRIINIMIIQTNVLFQVINLYDLGIYEDDFLYKMIVKMLA